MTLAEAELKEALDERDRLYRAFHSALRLIDCYRTERGVVDGEAQFAKAVEPIKGFLGTELYRFALGMEATP